MDICLLPVGVNMPLTNITYCPGPELEAAVKACADTPLHVITDVPLLPRDGVNGDTFDYDPKTIVGKITNLRLVTGERTEVVGTVEPGDNWPTQWPLAEANVTYQLGLRMHGDHIEKFPRGSERITRRIFCAVLAPMPPGAPV